MKANKQALVKTTSSDLQRKQLVNEYNTYLPKNLNKYLVEVKLIDHCVLLAKTSQVDTIGALIRATDQSRIESLIALYLVELNMVLGLNKPLNETQIEYIAQTVVSTYKAFTMADVYLIFRRAKNGEYGEFYESLTPPKVLRWFSNYSEERCLAFEQFSKEEGQKFKNSYIGDGKRTSEQAKQKEHEFKKFKLEYELKKSTNGKD